MLMSNRLVLIATGCLLATSSTALAQRKAPHPGAAYSLQTPGGVQPRVYRMMQWDKTPRAAHRAFARFQSEFGSTWRAMWDRVTGVPSRMFGPGLPAPGSIDYPAMAASYARSALARHIELLAPGAKASDFVLVSNNLSHKMRSVGFYQFHNGVRVAGGQLSFRFKNDRLFVIASEALPNVSARSGRKVSDRAARAAAVAWVLDDAAGQATARTQVGKPVILPIVGKGGIVAYRNVVEVTVDAHQPLGRWDVYIDAITGETVARRQTLLFATGTVNFNVPVRRPTSDRADYPAVNGSFFVDSDPITADGDGLLLWAGTDPVSLTLHSRGKYAEVFNQAGSDVGEAVILDPGATYTWDLRDDAAQDAQLAAFIHTNVIKAYARTIAPELAPFLDATLDIYVNIADACNAYFDGESLNFFQASADCANTGRLADVVYHEFGHAFHAAAIIPGVGSFDGAMGEGQADYLSATFNNDPGMGRGFFRDNSALRELDPLGREYVWPDDIGEIHSTGRIFGGTMWDLRKALVATYGQSAGVAMANQLYYAAIQRSSGIPSSYVEVLAADDDNGDITDGTPNDCTINEVFRSHGLRAVPLQVTSTLGVEPVRAEGYSVSMRVTGLRAACGDTLTGASLDWQVRGDENSGGTIVATQNGELYEAVIPTQPAGTVIQYQFSVELGDGSVATAPTNRGDPWYEFFVGEVVPLYCTDFETDPFANGWTHALTSGDTDDWQWGTPLGKSGDPSAAWSGDGVVGNNLGASGDDGLYRPDSGSELVSPEIDVGSYTDVRLQYRRWLNVEDGFFDHATISVNDVEAWHNYNSDQGNDSNVHHQDSEWRFHDVPLSPSMAGAKTIRVKFALDSDPGLQLGGWTIDDFCVVAFASSVCGDGEITGAEECDDGAGNNDTVPGACRTNCRFAYCGDGVVDDGEQCDDGNNDDSDDCTNLCEPPSAAADGGGGCCSAGGGASGSGSLLLGLLVGLALFRRRKVATIPR